jgi:hypothetical protein
MIEVDTKNHFTDIEERNSMKIWLIQVVKIKVERYN